MTPACKHSELYRERMYARYAEVQAPDWIKRDDAAERIAQRGHLRRLRGWLPSSRDAWVLDLGCGAGELLSALKASGYRNALGVDAGPQQAALAEQRGLSIIRADLRDYLRTTDQTFDLVLAFDVIEHFRKNEVLDMLDLIHARLNPGGSLILQTPNAASVWAAEYRYGDLTHEVLFTPGSLASTLSLASFSHFQVREVAPYVHGVRSAVRWALCRMIWTGCAIWHLAETGSLCGGVYSRNMLVRTVKADQAACCSR